ncbi:MAG: hypothetical protein V9G15_12470 [Dermatophilaceae bacterium]
MSATLNIAILPDEQTEIASATRRYVVLAAALAASPEFVDYVCDVAVAVACSTSTPVGILNALSNVTLQQLKLIGMRPVDGWDALGNSWPRFGDEVLIPCKFTSIGPESDNN